MPLKQPILSLFAFLKVAVLCKPSIVIIMSRTLIFTDKVLQKPFSFSMGQLMIGASLAYCLHTLKEKIHHLCLWLMNWYGKAIILKVVFIYMSMINCMKP